MLTRILVTHLILLVPGLLFLAPVLLGASPTIAISAAALLVGPLLGGILLAVALHLRAGEESLMPAGRLKESLSGGAIRPEAALLFLSPSGAFGATLVLSVGLEFALRFGVEKGEWGPTIAGVLTLIIGCIWALQTSSRVFHASFHRVLPRFIEFEHVPPFRELDTPSPPWGEGLWPLPGRALSWTMRAELRQLTRRHRILPALMLGAGLIPLAIEGASEASLLSPALVGLTCYLSTVMNPAFRLHSIELDHPALWRGWPLPGGSRALAQWAVALHVVTPAALFGILGLWISGLAPGAALATGALAWSASLALIAVTLPIARRASPEAGGVALLSHSAIIGAGLVLMGSLQG